MAKKILVVSGSPRRDGNTAALVEWFSEGARESGAMIEVAWAAFLKYKAIGCTSCRKCQAAKEYNCVIDDDARPVLAEMLEVDAIVMATPLYFFSASAQLKVIFDRMFSLYKWDNASGRMQTPLKGKAFILIASAFERAGLDELEKPFKMTADYTGMEFASLLVPDAGVSGSIRNNEEARLKALELGRRVAGMGVRNA